MVIDVPLFLVGAGLFRPTQQEAVVAEMLDRLGYSVGEVFVTAERKCRRFVYDHTRVLAIRSVDEIVGKCRNGCVGTRNFIAVGSCNFETPAFPTIDASKLLLNGKARRLSFQ